MASRNPRKGSDSQGYELYLMRHGAAEDSTGSRGDSERRLTPEGKQKLREVAKGLEAIGAEFDWIVTSPLKRAMETGEVIAEAAGAALPRDVCEALAPGSELAHRVTAFLSEQPERGRVLLIGHEPGFSRLASELLGAGRSAQLSFKKGGCCLIAFDDSPPRAPGHLSWWLTPLILRKLVC